MERINWTKEKLKAIITLWPDKSIEEIAEITGIPKVRIIAKATTLRKLGFNLPSKKVYMNRQAVEELARELGVTLKR